MNVVVLQGTLGRAPEERVLSSGGGVVEYEIRVRAEEGPVETVPVVWYEAPPSARSLAPGADVVVVGRVRRRFFRAGGTTQARTEVVAELVAPSRRRRQVGTAVERALQVVHALVPV